jgi:hypothetical protein
MRGGSFPLSTERMKLRHEPSMRDTRTPLGERGRQDPGTEPRPAWEILSAFTPYTINGENSILLSDFAEMCPPVIEGAPPALHQCVSDGAKYIWYLLL